MVSPSMQKEILEQLGKLEEKEQRQVLEFARTLAKVRPRGASGKTLIRLAEGIDQDDLQRMSNAIEEGRERVETIHEAGDRGPAPSNP